MMQNHGPISPEQWLAKLFSSRAARDGRVIRRQLRDIDRYFGRDRFMAELARRGHHAVENADQMIILCNREPIRVVLSRRSARNVTRKMRVSRVGTCASSESPRRTWYKFLIVNL